MPKSSATGESPASDSKRNTVRAEFGNYENAVTLVSSLQAWFEFRWGPNGKYGSHLLEFDRYPQLGQLTPDFLVKFKTPYVLCGEYLRSFRPRSTSSKDVDQILAYARHELPVPSGQKAPGYDVLVLVPPESDELASRELATARKEVPKARSTLAPIVLVSHYRDTSTSNGEWYKLMWRKGTGNRRFSKSNISEGDPNSDLNKLITERPFCSVRVTLPALDYAGQLPLTNDMPPPLYSAIRLLLPALNSILTDEERDTLGLSGKIEKTFSRDDILNAPILSSVRRHPKVESILKAAIEYLRVEVKGLKQIVGSTPQAYKMILSRRLLRDPFATWVEKVAAAHTPPKRKAGVAKRRKIKDNPGQQRWDW